MQFRKDEEGRAQREKLWEEHKRMVATERLNNPKLAKEYENRLKKKPFKKPSDFMPKIYNLNVRIGKWKDSKGDFLIGYALLEKFRNCDILKVVYTEHDTTRIVREEPFNLDRFQKTHSFVSSTYIRTLEQKDVDDYKAIDINVTGTYVIKKKREETFKVGTIKKITDDFISITLEKEIVDLAYSENEIKFMTESVYKHYEKTYDEGLKLYIYDYVNECTEYINREVSRYSDSVAKVDKLSKEYEIKVHHGKETIKFRPYGVIDRLTKYLEKDKPNIKVYKESGDIVVKYDILKYYYTNTKLSLIVVTLKTNYKQNCNIDVDSIVTANSSKSSGYGYDRLKHLCFNELKAEVDNMYFNETNEQDYESKKEELSYLMEHMPQAIKENFNKYLC